MPGGINDHMPPDARGVTLGPPIHTAPPPVRPLPLTEINQHVEDLNNLLADWFYDHADLTTKQLPLEMVLGFQKLADALDRIEDALDRIRRGELLLLPCGGVNDADSPAAPMHSSSGPGSEQLRWSPPEAALPAWDERGPQGKPGAAEGYSHPQTRASGLTDLRGR